MLWSLSAIFVPLGLGFLAVRIGAPLVANVMTLVMMLASLLTVLFWPAEVRIGKDGVSTRWLRRNQFIPIGSIRDADVGQVGIGNGKRVAVRVVLRGEDPVWIPVGMVGIGDGKAFEMSTRIKKAIADAAAEPQSALEQLRRGSAQPREWLARLHRIGAGAQTGPRSAAVTHEQLWRVVESPAASPLDRAAAAIALGKSGDASAKQRLHRIATTSAMPKLRVALDAAADEATEEQQLIEALEAIGEEKQGDARR